MSAQEQEISANTQTSGSENELHDPQDGVAVVTESNNTETPNLSSTENSTVDPEQNNGDVNTESKRVVALFDDISLNVVQFNNTFARNRGTLSQIVKSLHDMSQRLSTPINDYQKGLYPHIQTECLTVETEYSRLVSEVDKADYSVFGYYLNGPQNNGKRRVTTTRHEQKSYAVSEYKETLKSIDDRLRHIKIDCIRKTRDTTRTDRDVYNRVITFSDDFHKFITERLSAWDQFISSYRRTNGVVQQSTESPSEDSTAAPEQQNLHDAVQSGSRPKTTTRVKVIPNDSGNTSRRDDQKKGVKSKRHTNFEKSGARERREHKREEHREQKQNQRSKKTSVNAIVSQSAL